MLTGERELRAEIAADKAAGDARYERLLASLIGVPPEWEGPLVNGVAPVGGAFVFAPLALLETVAFTVNPLVRFKALATGRFLVGLVESGTMTLDASGNLTLTFTTPGAIVAGPLAVKIPANEFETLAGTANLEQSFTLVFVAEV